MEAIKNPDYLSWVLKSVVRFRDALEEFMKDHEINTEIARGIAPAVFPKRSSHDDVIEFLTRQVSEAAGRAMEAPVMTSCLITVQGAGKVNPIAGWHTITKPKPLLEPDDIFSACDQIVGRLDAMIEKAKAEAPPEIGTAAMHPLVWGAAKKLWRDRHFRQAVAAAAESVVSQLKITTGRNDSPDTTLWQESFSDKAPSMGKPRLRWPGDQSSRDVKSMNDGLRQFAPGVQMTIRNAVAHGTVDISEQDALERLAALSLLARWVEECDVIHVDTTLRAV